MPHKLEDINIGDEVTFRSKNKTPYNSHELSWTVTGKDPHHIFIRLDKDGFKESYSITIDEVVGHTPISKTLQ